MFTSTGANIAGTINVTGNANISNVSIFDNDITSTGTNANLDIDANGTGSIRLNSAGDSSNVIINGNTTSGHSNLLFVDAVNGRVGIRTATPSTNVVLEINSTTSAILPKGTTLERPGTGIAGMIRYNTSLSNYEFFDGDSWETFGQQLTVATSDTFNGDGSTLAFTLNRSSTTAATIVAINGVLQQPTTAYSVSGTTLTFTEAPLTGDVIDVRTLVTTTTVTSIAENNTSIGVADTGTGSAYINVDGTNVIVVSSTAATVTGNILPSANATYNLGATGSRWANIWGLASSAQYADLAEYYVGDADYAPGTVVDFGGSQEITVCSNVMSTRIAGVISTQPGFVMNDGQAGEFTMPVALQGRVPTKVVGSVAKGDMMVSAGNGHAMSCSAPVIGSVIGKALADFDGTVGVIEVVVGRI